MTDIEKIRREYDLIKSTLYIAAPFISSLLSRARVVVNTSIDTAAVSNEGVIIINPRFWDGLSWAGKAWVLAHETLHLSFRDHRRRGQRDARLFNIACDAVNNSLLEELIKMPERLKAFSVTMNKLYDLLEPTIDYEDFIKLSKEELYKLLEKLLPDQEGEGEDRDEGEGEGGESEEGESEDREEGNVEVADDLGKGDSSGETIQEGDPAIYRDGKEAGGEEEVGEKWRDAVARAYDLQKSIGKMPAGLKRIVDELLRSKVNWRSLLRQAFRNGFGKTVIESWKRPSRKSSDLPGLRRFTLPTVWCLIDTSGSISVEELRQFLSEVYEVAGQCPVKVVCWDTRAYNVIEAKSKNEVIKRVLGSLKGGGGTEIYNALEKTLKNMKYKDAVVVFTDGYIYDIDLDETKQLLSSIASKSSISIFVSTDKELEIPSWRFVKMEVG